MKIAGETVHDYFVTSREAALADAAANGKAEDIVKLVRGGATSMLSAKEI